MKTTKLDLVNEIAERTGYSKVDIELTIESFLLLVKDKFFNLQPRERLKLEIRGFGSFYSKVRKPRPARNPKNGDKVWIPARNVLLWRPFFKIIGGEIHPNKY